jgi:hypothetical protein
LKKSGQGAVKVNSENVGLSEEQLGAVTGGQKWYHHPPIRIAPVPETK